MNTDAINSTRSGVKRFGLSLGFSQLSGINDRPGPSSEDTESPEGEGKVKTKLMSMWNNMKYGWTAKINKTNFSKDSPVYLLGRSYHRKPDEPMHDDTSDCEGIEEFKHDFVSRLWMTYRREMPVINGSNFTTDCGWGCMLRSGQMMLAQALVCHFLGRDWRWVPGEPETNAHFDSDKKHRKIVKWFGDTSAAPRSPFSIRSLVQLGEGTGKKAGDWYGPGSVAHLIRMAVENAGKDDPELRDIGVYVAQDGAVYLDDVRDICQVVEPPNSDKPTQRSTWRAVIILVPVRLGAEKLNSIYGTCITDLLTLKQCIGIIGGRPRHSLYFVGFQEDKLIHLDPHYCQENIDVWQPNFPLDSFHCRSPRKINVSKMDPSCCLGFYCRSREDFEEFVDSVQKFVVPILAQKSEYPIFVFCEGRSKDALHLPQFSIPDDGEHRISQHDADFDLEWMLKISVSKSYASCRAYHLAARGRILSVTGSLLLSCRMSLSVINNQCVKWNSSKMCLSGVDLHIPIGIPL